MLIAGVSNLKQMNSQNNSQQMANIIVPVNLPQQTEIAKSNIFNFKSNGQNCTETKSSLSSKITFKLLVDSIKLFFETFI